MEFHSINSENKHFVNLIKAKKEQRHLVHYNAYWVGQSIIKDDILSFLIKKNKDYIAFIAFGQFYQDEYLQIAKSDYAEIIHIVIDEKFQGKQYSKIIINKAIKLLKENYKNILVAISKENIVSKSLFTSLNFIKTDLTNYDGDNIFELNKK